MEETLDQIYETLKGLVGLHRRLLECVRLEKEILISADVKKIQEVTYHKEALIGSIQSRESDRLKRIGELRVAWQKPLEELTLPKIIMEIQGRDSKRAERFQSVFNTLTILIHRIEVQNKENRVLVEGSLEHILEMKKNVLGASVAKSQTYSQQGQKVAKNQDARLISREV